MCSVQVHDSEYTAKLLTVSCDYCLIISSLIYKNSSKDGGYNCFSIIFYFVIVFTKFCTDDFEVLKYSAKSACHTS